MEVVWDSMMVASPADVVDVTGKAGDQAGSGGREPEVAQRRCYAGAVVVAAHIREERGRSMNCE